MSERDPRYDILFEPIAIGPVTAKNRFYQVPHCTGMGWLRPRMVAAMRGIKAEGGWGVVCTEYCSIHPSSDDIPIPSHKIWDDRDIKAHRLMTDACHEHGALAGIELWASGSRSPNLLTREIPRDVASLPNWNGHPIQSRVMDKRDIRELRAWHRAAAKRAVEAGFDIVYVYATHHYLVDNFLNPSINKRSDEYGGSQENRMRLLRELIEDTREAIGDKAALAVRYSVDDGGGEDGCPVHADRMEMFEALAELPDLWDINISDYSLEMGTSRFVPEGALENYLVGVKAKTTKPVVSVGRFTSPDTMVGQINRGVLDLIGAARPSIADPFLPRKIEEGREDEIRECIGCNICYTGDTLGYPLRCTQNPTMGEEWRRGWHPESIAKKVDDRTVLIVGAGPAGLEAAVALGKRGYGVALAEASRDLGGRVAAESALPGLSAWARVKDYRIHQLNKLTNVEVYRESELGLQDVLDFGADYVAVATGARWRDDGVGSYNAVPIPGLPQDQIFTPEDIFSERLPQGPTLVYDDDGFYLAGVIAEKLAHSGIPVTYVTPFAMVSNWTANAGEQSRVHRSVARAGVDIILNHGLDSYDGESAEIACTYTEKFRSVAAVNIVMVTSRNQRDHIYHEIRQAQEDARPGAPLRVNRVGDAEAPSIIAAAVYSGHRYARELESEVQIAVEDSALTQ